MVLLDSVISVDDAAMTCALAVRDDSLFMEAEGVPALVGIEYMAQAIAAHAGWRARRDGDSVKPGFLLGTPRFTAHKPYFERGGDFRVDVAKDWGDDEMMRFDCQITHAQTGETYVAAGLNVFQPKNLDAYLAGGH